MPYRRTRSHLISMAKHDGSGWNEAEEERTKARKRRDLELTPPCLWEKVVERMSQELTPLYRKKSGGREEEPEDVKRPVYLYRRTVVQRQKTILKH